MKLRRLNPEDFITMENNMNIAFCIERSAPPEDKYDEYLYCYGAFTDEGKMTSSVVANPYRCTYWGQSVGMCGVGGVATFPEYRREGHMRHLMPYVLKAAYDRGDVLSALFPFSHPFYRKFGFECCGPVQTCSAGLPAFRDVPVTGRVRQVMPGEDYAEIRAVYAAYQREHNFLCDRDADYWTRLLGEDPYVTHRHTYLWYDEDGRAQAYCLLRHVQSGGQKDYEVIDWAYVSPAALRGLFGLFRLLTPSGRDVRFKLPADADLFSLIPDPYDIHIRLENCGMLRVINAEKALKLHPWREELKGFTVRVNDPDIEENCRMFRVECGGETRVTADDGAEPDLEVSIQALSRLLCGACTLSSALRHREDVRAKNPTAALLAAFEENAMLLIEPF